MPPGISSSGKALGVIREEVGQDLEGHIPVEFRIPSPIHLAHAATADQGSDLVGAETGARAHRRG